MAISVGRSWGWKSIMLVAIVVCSDVAVGYAYSTSSDLIYSVCNVRNYSEGSEYESNVKTVLRKMGKDAPRNGGFSTYSYGHVYGLLQCRGDVSSIECSKCSKQAAKLVVTEECPNAMGARIQLEHCFLRYENYTFASQLDAKVWYALLNPNNVSNDIAVGFNKSVGNLMKRLSSEASRNNINRFSSGSSKSPAVGHTIYGMEMCWTSLSAHQCGECLSKGLAAMDNPFPPTVGAQLFLGTCTLRYEMYPFTYRLHL